MAQKKKLSMKEIAEICNVSVATVSRVINQNGRFSKETERRVFDAIEKYGYQTNLVAKSLRMRQTKSIGIIVPNIKNEFYASIVLEIENFFFSEGYSVFICNSNDEEEKEQQYLKSLDAKGVDGLIYISGKENMSLDSAQRKIPIVCIDRRPKIEENIAIIDSDNYHGGFLATEELIERGCQRIAIMRSRRKLSTTEARFLGYQDALWKHDFHEELVINLDQATFDAAKTTVKQVVEEGTQFDGIFATDDWLALGALIGLQELGAAVPEDYKIVGFDNISISKYSFPSITTIDQDKKRLGIEAAKALLYFINEDEKNEKIDIVVPVKLIRRETT